MTQVHLTLQGLDIQIECSSRDLLMIIKDHFSYYIEGYRFMPQYRAGSWDGKTCLFNTSFRRLPYGLLFELLKLLKKNKCEVTADDNIKNLFGDNTFDPNQIEYNLLFQPRYYQKDAIEQALKYKCGSVVIPTAGGKCVYDLEVEIEMDDEIYNKYFSDYTNLE